MKTPYFSLEEVALISLCGALVFLLRVMVKVPLHIPGHSGIFWVIPVMAGSGIIRKPGAGTCIGIISGILVAFFGMDTLPLFDILKYCALGMSIDLLMVVFAYPTGGVAAGFVIGAAGNVVKMIVDYLVLTFFGMPAVFIALGIGVSAISHIIFGGIGGIIAVQILSRLRHGGLIHSEPY